MKYNALLIVLIILILLTGCKKTKLEGELNLLEGKWGWIKSESFCDGGTNICTYDPSSEGIEIDYIFEEKGKYQLVKNGKKIESGRLQIETYTSNALFSDGGSIRVNFKKNIGASINATERMILVGEDTLLMSEYPMEDLEGWNYYVRK